MFMSERDQFAYKVATGDVGTNLLGDVLDLDSLGPDTNASGDNLGVDRDIGLGNPLYLNAVVTDDITAGAGGTYAVELVSASDAAITTDVTTHVVSGTFDAASTIEQGTRIIQVALPIADGGYGRYLAVREVVGTANTTAGTVTAFLALDQVKWKPFVKANTSF